ncbi:response regulator [Cytophagaceae bacterium ABcell3]|nr:response regulator [Cytophagaceae bacterium ABcell3]
MNTLDSVLLVDDDNINNYLNARLIKKLRITDNVKISLNGAEALKYLSSENKGGNCPSLIFLDINMPVMNGFEFLDQFRKEKLCASDPVIIMLTTSTNDKDVEIIKKDASVAGFINKPLTEDKLKGILDKHFSYQ